MARVYRVLAASCWGLGVLSLVIGVAIKLFHTWAVRFDTSPTGGLVLAGTLFLCALATRGIEAGDSSTGGR
jgi:hypothetical protein